MTDRMLGTNITTQVAIVVRDIEATSRAWAELLGVDVPPWMLTDPAEKSHTRYHGEATEGQAKLAFFDLGGVKLELIEPVDGPSTWREHLDTRGEGVHHVAFGVEGLDGIVAQLGEAGMPLAQTGQYTGGRYAYVDASDKLKVVLELLESTG